MSLIDLFGFFSWFSKREPPPPRGALAFVARATSSEVLEAEWPLRTFSINEQVQGKWDTQIRFLIVDSLPGGPAGKSTFRVKRVLVGYLPQKAVAAGQSRIRMHGVAPGMLSQGDYYLCSFAEGTVSGMAAFGY